MKDEICPHCGKPTRIASVARCHGMFEMMLFHEFHASNPDELINMWKDQCSHPYPAVVGDELVHDLGRTSLCPVIVLDQNGVEMRRVGEMVHRSADLEAVEIFRLTLWADPDIPRLLKDGKTGRKR